MAGSLRKHELFTFCFPTLPDKSNNFCVAFLENFFIEFRDGLKTQPPVDRRFRPVLGGFYRSKQWQPPGTGRNRRSTGGWVLKPPLTNYVVKGLLLRKGSVKTYEYFSMFWALFYSNGLSGCYASSMITRECAVTQFNLA